MKTIYQTFRNADMTEGRGPMIADIAFEHESEALKYISKQPGVMGRIGMDWEVRAISLYESANAATAEYLVAFRRKTLAKLTPEEKKVLGLE